MLLCFKRYVIAVCAIAIALPVAASTLWPLVTGQMMAASLGGLILEFVLFFAGFLIAYQIFSRRADAVADGYVHLYNVDCNPEAFLTHGRALADVVTFPCNGQCAWFMGYYAQACLDAGRGDEARIIEEGLRQSIAAQKRPQRQCAVIIALIPLVEKLGTLDEARNLAEQGLSLISSDASQDAAVQRQYLESQIVVTKARQSGDLEVLVELDEKVVASAAYPWRLRVEYAWDAASACFKLGRADEERRYLLFIEEHGGTLALVPQAEKRLQAMASSPLTSQR